MNKHATQALWLVPAAVVLIAMVHVSTVPRLPPAPPADEAARARIAERVYSREAAMRRSALERFPGDPWSQGDDFGNAERRLVRELAAREKVRPSSVLEAIDHDVRTRPSLDPQQQRIRGGVAPCMPRPFYD